MDGSSAGGRVTAMPCSSGHSQVIGDGQQFGLMRPDEEKQTIAKWAKARGNRLLTPKSDLLNFL